MKKSKQNTISKATFPELQLQQGLLKDSVYDAIRSAILSGHLQANMKLPSSRHLSQSMAVSRNTVLSGLERLLDEGYLYTKPGSGTYIHPHIPDDLLLAQSSNTSNEPQKVTVQALSNRIGAMKNIWTPSTQQASATTNQLFAVGVGCVDIFPHKAWGRVLGRVWRQQHHSLIANNDVSGSLPLRQAICQYIQSTRGLKCQAEQILITSGTQQAIHLSAQVLLNPGDVVALDEPGYDGALGAFLSHDLQIFDMDSDEEGMIIEPLHSQSNIGLVYSTPSHHFPLGKTMSLSRRLQLLDWAHQENKWIFEDDYNGEFRYHTRAIQSLQGLDQHQRVIYSGTFSKMLYPGFRLGFLVVPPALMDGFQVAKHFTDMCNSTLEQAILAEFIMEGAYAKHVRLVRQACAERQLALIEAIHRYLDDILTVQAADTGIHLLAQIQSGWHMTDVITASQALGFSVQPLSRYARKTLSKEAVLFGYAAHQPDQITAGIQQLANKIRQIKEAP